MKDLKIEDVSPIFAAIMAASANRSAFPQFQSQPLIQHRTHTPTQDTPSSLMSAMKGDQPTKVVIQTPAKEEPSRKTPQLIPVPVAPPKIGEKPPETIHELMPSPPGGRGTIPNIAKGPPQGVIPGPGGTFTVPPQGPPPVVPTPDQGQGFPTPDQGQGVPPPDRWIMPPNPLANKPIPMPSLPEQLGKPPGPRDVFYEEPLIGVPLDQQFRPGVLI